MRVWPVKHLLSATAASALLLTGCFDHDQKLKEQSDTVDELRKDLRKLQEAQKPKPVPPPPPVLAPPPPRLGPGDFAAPLPRHPYGPGDF